MTCPHCGSQEVYRSRRRKLEKLASWLTRRRPMRCLACGHRFWVWW